MTQFEADTIFYYEKMLEETEQIKKDTHEFSSTAVNILNELKRKKDKQQKEDDHQYSEVIREHFDQDLKLQREIFDSDQHFQEVLLANLDKIQETIKEQLQTDEESKGEFLVKFALDGADELSARQFRHFLEELAELDSELVAQATDNIIKFYDVFTEERQEKLNSFQDTIHAVQNSVEHTQKAEEEAQDNKDYDGLKNLTQAMLMVGGTLALFVGMVALLDARTLLGGLALMITTVGAMILLSKLSERIGDTEEVGDTIDDLSKSMILFGGALAIFSGLIYVLDTPTVLTGLGLLTASVGVMVGIGFLLDRFNVNLSRFGRDLFLLSGSMIAFAGSLGVVSYLMNEHVDQTALELFGLILGITTAGVLLMGKVGTVLLKGAAAMGAIAATIGLFGMATSYAVNQLTQHDFSDYLSTLAVIAGTAAVVAGAGLLLPFILPGAAALAAMGVSLGLVGIGLRQIQDIDIDSEQASETAKSLTSFLKPFALFGMVAPLVIAGSIALGFASGALLMTGAALRRMPEVDESKMETMENSINRMLKVVSMDPTGISRLLGSDRPSFPEVMAGSVAIMGASSAIINIVDAMKAALDVEISEDEWQRILTMVGRVPMLFAEVETEGGFDLFGRTVVMNDVQKGIASIKGVGIELTNIVTALVDAADVDLGDPEDSDSKFAQIKNMIAAVPGFFAGYGSGRLEFAGFTLRQSDVEKGISAIQGSGTELLSIVKTFKKIGQVRDVEESSKKFGLVFSNFMDHVANYDYDNINHRQMRRVFNSTQLLTDQILGVGEFNQGGGFSEIFSDFSEIETLNDPVIEFTSNVEKMNDTLEDTVGIMKSIEEQDLDNLASQLESFIRESKMFDVRVESDDGSATDTNRESSTIETVDGNIDIGQLNGSLQDMKGLLRQLIFTLNAQHGANMKQAENTNDTLSQMLNELDSMKRNF